MVAFTRDGAVWSSPISGFFEEFRVASSPSEEGREPTLGEDSALYEKLKADGHWRLFGHVTHAGAAGVRSCTPITASVPKHPLQEVFDAVIAQVTTGKGQRHGGGEQPFFEQPWFTTTQQVGIGFPLGQAMKKLGESSSKPDAESFETELLGGIAYAAMAYLANKKLAGKS